MNRMIHFKNAIALIVIAGAIIFIGDIVTAASPEVVNPDVSSPEVVITRGRAIVADFNGDLHPDFVLYNPSTRQTAIWYMNNNVHIGSHFGPTIPTGWVLECAEDFNDDNQTDYVLFNPTSRGTLFDYMSGPTLIASGPGPTLPSGWELVVKDDFNLDGFADYVLYNPSSHQTAIWYLHNNIRIGGAF